MKLALALMLVAQGAWATPADELISGQRKECRGCDLSGVSFKKANLAGVDLTGANLTNASFHRANLRGAILDGVTANGTNFNLIDGTQANFKGADLTRAMLYGAQLSGADFSDANLTEARLQSMASRHESVSISLTLQLSSLEEVDMAKTITSFQTTQTQLEASYRAIAMAQQLSLTRFL